MIDDEVRYKKMMLPYVRLMDHVEDFSLVMKRVDEILEHSDLPIVEVGTRAGGSALCFMDLVHRREKKNWVYTIDPYGAISWSSKEGVTLEKSSYVNRYYQQAMVEISTMAFMNELNHHHFKCTSKEFVEWVYPNFRQYDNEKNCVLTNFCFVYLDGDHGFETVSMELDFFLPRITKGGCVIVDDTQHTIEQLDEYCENRYKVTHMNKRSMVENYD